MAGCAGGPRAYAFYDELGDALAAPQKSDLDGTHQTLAAMREALRAATSAEEVASTLEGWTGAPPIGVTSCMRRICS